MKPHELLGFPYRLGADPNKHGAADCLSLAREVVNYYGYSLPPAQRDWYRRLRRKDYSVFSEELNRWGIESTPKLGAIALCESDYGLGLASYYFEGWLSFQDRLGKSAVVWSPIEALSVHGVYFQRKPISATL